MDSLKRPASADSRLLNATLWLILTLGVGYLMVVAKGVIIPFVIAVFLWYLVNTLASVFGKPRIQGRQAPVWLRYLLSGGVMLGAAAAVASVVSSSLGELVEAAPEYQHAFERLLREARMEITFVELPALAQLFEQIDLGSYVRTLAGAVGGLLGNLGMIATYLLFLFLEQRYLAPKLTAMAECRENEVEVRSILRRVDQDIQTYINIKTLCSLATAAATYVVLTLVGLDFAGFWALLAFVLNFIPSVGSLIATALPALLALVQFDTFGPFLVVIACLGTAQMLIGNVAEPHFMGKSLNLSPLVLIVTLVVFGAVWGVPGMFLSVPLTVITMIVLARFPSTRWVAAALSQDGRIGEFEAESTDRQAETASAA